MSSIFLFLNAKIQADIERKGGGKVPKECASRMEIPLIRYYWSWVCFFLKTLHRTQIILRSYDPYKIFSTNVLRSVIDWKIHRYTIRSCKSSSTIIKIFCAIMTKCPVCAKRYLKLNAYLNCLFFFLTF